MQINRLARGLARVARPKLFYHCADPTVLMQNVVIGPQ